MSLQEYNIFDLGFNKELDRSGDSEQVNTELFASIDAAGYQGGLADLNNEFTAPASFVSGSLAANVNYTGGVANQANLNVGTGSNLAGLNSANAGGDVAFWAGATYANRASAPFTVTAAGALTASSVSITGLTNYQTFTSGTSDWTKPTNAEFVYVVCIGAGGGGGSGSGAAAAARNGGSGGGGGAIATRLFNADDLAATVSVTIGAGGTGGAAGNSGTAGGNSSFGTHLVAYGGGAGVFPTGGNTDDSSGGGGGGILGVGANGDTQNGVQVTVLGGSPSSTAGANGLSGQGGGGNSRANTTNAENGGGGGGGSYGVGTAVYAGGSSGFAAGGGGSGGSTSITTGGAGGNVGSYAAGGGGAGGTGGVTATVGTAGTAGTSLKCGTGGGGGGAVSSGSNAGGAGGVGGAIGGGGGGGGASWDGVRGAGGNGGRGEVRVYSW